MKHLLFGLLIFFTGQTAIAAEEIPLVDFFKHPQYRGIQISPDGKYFAVVVPFDDQEKLVIIDRAAMKPVNTFVFGENRVIGMYRWVNDERILVSPARKLGSRDLPAWTGDLYAGNADGTKKIQLLGPGMTGEQFSLGFTINKVFRDNPREILITKGGTGHYPTAYWLNVYSGDLRRAARSPVRNGRLGFDGDGIARVATGTTEDNHAVVMYRDNADAEWREISRSGIGEPSINPVQISTDNRHVLAFSNRESKTKALVKFDPSTNAVQLLLHDQAGDIADIILDRTGDNVIGAWFEPDYPKAVYIDDKHPDAVLHRRVANLFRTARAEITSFTRDGRLATVVVSSDKEPGAYYLFDTIDNKMTPLLRTMPWIEPNLLADREAIKLTTRDGLDMYGFLTLPKGKDKNLPLIMLPHGGPHGPYDNWSFDPEAQFFANRGYAVLQVNFRGSGGYGREFQAAGFRKWHTAMQDDLTDAVGWAVAEQIADPNRICIYGASYGGYAALMSPIREPDLYKCAVGYVGVYDMALMYGKGDIPERPEGRAYLERVLGTDEAELQAMSPVHNVEKLKAALFLVHGEKDVRAHFQHFLVLREALDKRQYPYEFLTKPKEAHGFYNEDNRIELYTKMLAFFDTHIGDKKAAH